MARDQVLMRIAMPTTVALALLMAIMFVLRLTLKQSETASGPRADPIRAASCSRHQQRL